LEIYILPCTQQMRVVWRRTGIVHGVQRFGLRGHLQLGEQRWF